MAEAEVFQLDGTPRSSFSKQRLAEDAAASSSDDSEPVALRHAAAFEANGQEQGSSSDVPKQPNESIELSRRAVPVRSPSWSIALSVWRCWREARAWRALHNAIANYLILQEVQQDPDVCSICLDEFTDEDPSNSTQCGCAL